VSAAHQHTTTVQHKGSSVTWATLRGTEPCRRAVAMRCFTQEKWDQLLANIRSKCQGQLPLGDEPQAFFVAPDCARAESAGNPIHHACELNMHHVIMWPNPHTCTTRVSTTGNITGNAQAAAVSSPSTEFRVWLSTTGVVDHLLSPDHARSTSRHSSSCTTVRSRSLCIRVPSACDPTQRAVRHRCPPTTPCTALHRAFHSLGTLL
jgi:hypothetical protein